MSRAGIVTAVRDLMPLRPLTAIEAMHVAERQALRLLALSGVTEPPVPNEVITKLPRVQVERMTPFQSAGASQWSLGRWLIVINGADPAGRQRFTLYHEAKHIFDSPFVHQLYPPQPGMSAHERAEVICDYFAGCVLMPRSWVKRAWGGGEQDIAVLARRFEVSRQAMRVRLLQLGLLEPEPRCSVPSLVRASRPRAKLMNEGGTDANG